MAKACLLIVLLAGLFLVGCGGAPEAKPAEADKPAEEKPVEAPAEEAAEEPAEE